MIFCILLHINYHHHHNHHHQVDAAVMKNKQCQPSQCQHQNRRKRDTPVGPLPTKYG